MSAPSYRPTAGLRRWLVPMLVGAAVIAGARCVSSVVDASLWSGAAEDPSGASLGALVMADNRRVTMSILQLVWLLTTAVVFVIWFHRMYGNLRVLGSEPKQQQFLAVAGWMIPIANLFVPWLIAKELASEGPAAPRRSGLVHLWWAAWLVAALASIGVNNMFAAAVFPQEFADASSGAIFSEALLAATAVLAALVVRALDDRQRAQVEQHQLLPA